METFILNFTVSEDVSKKQTDHPAALASTLDFHSQWVLDLSHNTPDQEGDGGRSRILIYLHMSGLAQKMQWERVCKQVGAPVD